MKRTVSLNRFCRFKLFKNLDFLIQLHTYTWGPAKLTCQNDLPGPATYHVTGGGGKRGQPATFQIPH
jgi:hypothetical protein